MMINKKLGLAALVLIALVATVAAATLRSNILTLTTTVSNPTPLGTPILITQAEFPTAITKGTVYTFYIDTKNTDPYYNVTGIINNITITGPSTLTADMVTVHYHGLGGDGNLTFTADGTSMLHYSSGLWDAPIGYDDYATYKVTVNMNAPTGAYTVTARCDN
jgi:hypothetical protein